MLLLHSGVKCIKFIRVGQIMDKNLVLTSSCSLKLAETYPTISDDLARILRGLISKLPL